MFPQCMASTTAFSFGAMILASQEEGGVGLQWDNIDKDVMGRFDMSWVMIMMLADSGLYFLIGWYVRNVKPGKRKHIFQYSYLLIIKE